MAAPLFGHLEYQRHNTRLAILEDVLQQDSASSIKADSISVNFFDEIDKSANDAQAPEQVGEKLKGLLNKSNVQRGDGNGLLRGSCVDRAAESIREYIRSENLQTGDRLPGELAIAQSLHMSRRALREAISRLECLGLVEVRHGTGIFVASRDHLGACVDFVRSALSDFAARSRALCRNALCGRVRRGPHVRERATAEGVAELTDLCAAIDRPELPYVDSLKTDFAFHRKIVGLTGNILMQNVMEVLQPFVVAGMVHTTPQPRDYGHSRRHHEQILNAIRDGNADEAEAAMKRHMVLQLCRLPLNVRDIASADRGDMKIIEQLYKQAHESEKSIKTRLSAVNNLGEIAKSPNEVEVLETIKEKLKGLLNNPNVQPDEENGFLAAVVGAIADLGPNGRELLPHLARARGRFAEVDAAIALAETSILHSPQLRANADVPNELTYQATILNDLHKPVHHRLAAAKFFGDDMIINKYSETLGQVIEPVLKAMKKRPRLRCATRGRRVGKPGS